MTSPYTGECSSSFPKEICRFQLQITNESWDSCLSFRKRSPELWPCVFLSRCQLTYLCIYRELILVNTVRGCPWLQLHCPEFGVMPYVLFQSWIKYWGNGLLWRRHVLLLFFSFPSCFFERVRSNSVREEVWLPRRTGCNFSIRHLNMQLWLTVLQLYPPFQLLGWFHSDVISVGTGRITYPCL